MAGEDEENRRVDEILARLKAEGYLPLGHRTGNLFMDEWYRQEWSKPAEDVHLDPSDPVQRKFIDVLLEGDYAQLLSLYVDGCMSDRVWSLWNENHPGAEDEFKEQAREYAVWLAAHPEAVADSGSDDEPGESDEPDGFDEPGPLDVGRKHRVVLVARPRSHDATHDDND